MSPPRFAQVPLVLSIDQGTTSTRAILFTHDAVIVGVCQKEHQQIFPQPGWVEHDALELWDNCREVVAGVLARANVNHHQIRAVGVTNQRETAVVWNKHTGDPVYNAIVWQDTRTQSYCRELETESGIDFPERTGLPPTTYFSGPKIKWILNNVEGARAQAEAGDLLFGTIDSWLIWNMSDQLHITDVTNASRTMLMDIHTLKWDAELCEAMSIPMCMLPEIRSSSEIIAYGRDGGFLEGCPISGILGDQQAATFGQACFDVGDAKTTYGSGAFLLLNVGATPIKSNNGLLTTVAFKIGEEDPVYALEGSVAVGGSLVRWLRDQMGIIGSAQEVETLAKTVEDNGGCYFVPAFSGLYAPHWRPDARGMIHGLSFFNTKGHIARAALESTAFQTKDVCDAMVHDLQDKNLTIMRVDGGMTNNDILMQFQSDILDCRVVRSEVTETTALGAAFAAGLAVGFWEDLEELKTLYRAGKTYYPDMQPANRINLLASWRKAVEKSCGWMDDVSSTDNESKYTSSAKTSDSVDDWPASKRDRFSSLSTVCPEIRQ